MVNTIRTFAELNALFDDTTIPTNQDIRDFILSLMVHGVVGIGSNTVTQSVDTGYGGNEVVFPSEIHSRGLDIDLVAGTITTRSELTKAKYDIGWELNLQGQGVSNEGEFSAVVFKNSTKLVSTERTFQIKGTEWTHVYCRIPGIQLLDGDTLQLAIVSGSGTKDVLIAAGQLSCQRLGVE